MRARGLQIHVLDNDRASATSVAAGVVTPVTGPRLALTWGFHTLAPAASKFYANCAREWKVPDFYQSRPIVRAFADDAERIQLRKQCERRDDIARLIDPVHPAWPQAFANAPLGCFQMNAAGRLDTRAFLAGSARVLRAEGRLERGAFDWNSLDPEGPIPVGDGRVAARVVSCEGYNLLENPWFDDLPFIPAKGELLQLRIPGLRDPRILNRRGRWLLHIKDDLWQAGATFQKEVLDELPSKGARREILAGIESYLRAPIPEDRILSQRAGVRPIIPGAKLAIGPHPDHPRLLAFNGLGSKGVLRAPYFAEQLAAWIHTEAPLDSESTLATHMLRARQKKRDVQRR